MTDLTPCDEGYTADGVHEGYTADGVHVRLIQHYADVTIEINGEPVRGVLVGGGLLSVWYAPRSGLRSGDAWVAATRAIRRPAARRQTRL
jgi:hypothetical protein